LSWTENGKRALAPNTDEDEAYSRCSAAVAPASSEDVGEANEVGLRIGMGVYQRMPHADVSAEMDDIGKLAPGEERRHALRSARSSRANRKVG
jgi:hypothetical protein